MKLCSSDAKCGYVQSQHYRKPAELILEISQNYGNKENVHKVEQIVSYFLKQGYNLTYSTNYLNSENLSSIRLILTNSKNKSLLIYSNKNKIDNFKTREIDDITTQIERNLY